jgi:hypothetical protein
MVAAANVWGAIARTPTTHATTPAISLKVRR